MIRDGNKGAFAGSEGLFSARGSEVRMTIVLIAVIIVVLLVVALFFFGASDIHHGRRP